MVKLKPKYNMPNLKDYDITDKNCRMSNLTQECNDKLSSI